MEARAALPPGLPRPNPTVSFWQSPPAALAHHRSTEALPPSADVVIIGGGITGTSIAYHLLAQSQQPAPPVVLLEARTACSGATGRNGGHTKTASHGSFLRNVETLGEEEAVRVVRFEYRCMKAVHAFARRQGIACDSWEGDTVDIFYDEAELDSAKRSIAAVQKALGSDDPAARYAFWNAEDAARKFLAPNAVGAITYEAGSISAYKFVTGVLALAVEKGLNLQTETPVTAIGGAQNGWEVLTARGAIRALKVVLATNGFTAHLYPKLQGIIVPLRGHMSAQHPGSGMPSTGLSTTYTFVYGKHYEYMIQRPQGTDAAGRIMIGGCTTKSPDGGTKEWGTTDDTSTDPIIVKLLGDCTKEYFGDRWGEDHPNGRLSHYWTGIMGFSPDGYPFVGELPGETDLFIAASFQGQGMVVCFLVAEASAYMINGQDEKAAALLPRAFRVTKQRMSLNHKGWL